MANGSSCFGKHYYRVTKTVAPNLSPSSGRKQHQYTSFIKRGQHNHLPFYQWTEEYPVVVQHGLPIFTYCYVSNKHITFFLSESNSLFQEVKVQGVTNFSSLKSMQFTCQGDIQKFLGDSGTIFVTPSQACSKFQLLRFYVGEVCLITWIRFLYLILYCNLWCKCKDVPIL